MAKEIAIGKRAKISEAQQHMLLAVLIASLFLGAAICLIIYFVKQISFNTAIIMEQEQSIVKFSKTIKNIGVCKKPSSGEVYSDKDLENCNPDSITSDEVPGSLRAIIIDDLAANKALNSVPQESNSSCHNSKTGKNYTYDELIEKYKKASNDDLRTEANNLIKSCSALRVIPNALPAYKNQEALLASLNKIFNVSGWEPESISPTEDVADIESVGGINPMTVSFGIEASTGTAMKVIYNIERSIRDINIMSASIEWRDETSVSLMAEALSYFMDESSVSQTVKNIKAEEGGESK